MTSRTGSAWRIWGILKKSVELRTRHRTRRVDFRGSQRPDEFARYETGDKWKSHHRKIVHLSSLWRNLLLKGNKRFRTWTKKWLRVFRVSRFLCSMYICYEHSMYVSHIRIYAYYGYVTVNLLYTWTKKSLRIFRVSEFLCSMYICYKHSMYVSHIRIMGMVPIYIPQPDAR